MRAVRILAVVYFVFTALGVLWWRASERSSQAPSDYAIEAAAATEAPTPQLQYNGVSDCTLENIEAWVASSTDEGVGYTAVCWAVDGKFSEASALMEGLPPQLQSWAAGQIFGATHPAVDSGQEAELAPAMELVVKYQPNNVMALYHAGSAAYGGGRVEAARDYLGRFISLYGPNDGWKNNAEAMIESLD